jgi:hypothetical protein
MSLSDTLMTIVDSVVVAGITGTVYGEVQDQLRVNRVLSPSPPSDTCQAIAVYTPLHIHPGWLLGQETLRKSSTRRLSLRLSSAPTVSSVQGTLQQFQAVP